MTNAKIVAHVLLATVAFGATHRLAAPTKRPSTLLTFLSTAGSHRFTTRAVQRRHVTRVQPLTYTVTATAYQAVVGQTDNEPFVTADNSRIKPHYGSKMRWMALSNDLLARWGGKFQYGDKVRVMGISPKLDGVYTVHDTMNKRHRHCIDILTHPSEKFDIFTPDVKIQLVAAAKQIPPKTLPPTPPPTPRLRSQAIAKARPGRNGPPAGPRPRGLPHSKRIDYFASAIL
jgi:3D (Asp-Asp-Asp) domain-containing protein